MEYDHTHALTEVELLATKEIGSQEKAQRWPHKSNRALYGDTPYDRTKTREGYEQVKPILHQLEDELFS